VPTAPGVHHLTAPAVRRLIPSPVQTPGDICSQARASH